MLGYLAGVVGIVAVSILTIKDPCPQKLELGLTYNQIKAGPCPDLGPQAVDTLQGQPGDYPGRFPIYKCESLSVLVVGDRTTGKTVGLLRVTF